ncbi:NYN domain-containing protein [Mycobacterium malmoense]|uniref:NYN domain-containing protein n=1 Tax=Mycobacterium malmoense TaxID=1780 RepID=UPI001C4312B9|nr:NYN domain-containing protein [Mycobacterium malmoense]
MSETLAVYVDGFNLYYGLHEVSGRRHLWLDLVALASKLRPRSALVKVKYFTAPVLNDPGAQSRQSDYLAALTAQNPGLIDIINGRYQAKPKACRRCNHSWTEYEEKETDVNIAAHLVADAALKMSDAALIVSADSDLAPAVRVARMMNPNLFIAAVFPPRRLSSELQALMPASFHLGVQRIKRSQLPQMVFDATGGGHGRDPRNGARGFRQRSKLRGAGRGGPPMIRFAVLICNLPRAEYTQQTTPKYGAFQCA